MKTLTVQNGDLQLDSGGKLKFERGSSKLIQDLRLWLQEPLGQGFTTPNFGSTLVTMIGGTIQSGTSVQVQAEVQRILNLYQTQQLLTLQTYQNLSQLSNWNKSEIIYSIDSVTATPYYTSMNVAVSLTTLAGTKVSINLFINPSGVQVQ